MRYRTFTTFTLFALLAAGCGEQAKHAAQPPSPKPDRTGAGGGFRRLGPAKGAFAAVVPSHATVAHRPGGKAFARFGRLNVNGVPVIFSIRGARIDRRCRPASYLVQIPRRPNGVTGWGPAGQGAGGPLHSRRRLDLAHK